MALSDITCAISEMQQTLQNGAAINPAKQRSDHGENEVLLNGNVCRIEGIKNYMETFVVVYALGTVIVGGIYLWTFTKRGKEWLKKL